MGRLLKAFKETHVSVPAELSQYVAVEPDSGMARQLGFAWKHFCPESNLVIVPEIDLARGKFDLIVLSHVLEHLVDPNHLLEQVRGFLDKDGWVFIEVPHN